MKKTVSCTLAATLAAAPLQGFANEVVTENNEQITEISQSTGITGKLEVDMNFYMPIVNSTGNDIKVKLTGTSESLSEEVSLAHNSGVTKSGAKYTIEKLDSKRNVVTEENAEISFVRVIFENLAKGQTKSGAKYTIEKLDSKRNVVTEENAEISFVRVIFENLAKGQYNIELSGKGYKTATVNNIDITSYSKRVKIGTKQNEVVTKYGETEKENVVEEYPALFLAGDVNEDDIITMGDYNIVLNSIKNNENKYDINKDSKTDISDLATIKSSINTQLKINMI